MRRKTTLVLFLLSLVFSHAGAAELELEGDIRFLAQDPLEGRLTGTEGARRAAEFLASRLEKLGAKALPGRDSFLVPFEFTSGVRDSGSSLTLLSSDGSVDREWSAGEHLRALSLSDYGEVEGEVVFAGYGLVIPEREGFPYDSYFGLDVEDKIVVVLRYFPEDTETATRAILSRYAGLRYKALYAREHGAKALLVVTGPRSPNAGELVRMSFDTAVAGSGLVAASISGSTAEVLLAVADQSLEQSQAALDTANPHETGFALEGLRLRLTTEVERERRSGSNVVAYFPATADGLATKPWVLLGAHYDHLGRGGHGNSLARKGEAGDVHPGADDNASGVAGILAVAELLASEERRRAVAVALWSGEEMGLLGSAAFVEKGVLPVGELAAYINFDMVGRMRDNRLVVQAVGSSPRWPKLIEQVNVVVGFDLQVQEDPYLPTDTRSFNQAQVPTLNLFTGSHEDYHRPSDVAEKINYEDLERVVRFAALLTKKVVNSDQPPQFVKVETKVESSAGRDGVRAFTGTIPDYTSEGEGLLLSGVVGGGPADEAGLREGDVIVRFGGQDITNIYDYTYALDAVKVDKPLEVVYLRDGQELTTTLTPRARN
jgi:hypothetical protein